MFAPRDSKDHKYNNNDMQYFFSYVSAFDRIFVRDYQNGKTIKQIYLPFTPLCFSLASYADVASELSL